MLCALTIFLDLKQKILEHRENSEQIESLQCQELSKVKQLVLEKDRELSDKNAALKDANNQLEKLRSELNRLRRQEETLSDVQVSRVVFISVQSTCLKCFFSNNFSNKKEVKNARGI